MIEAVGRRHRTNYQGRAHRVDDDPADLRALDVPEEAHDDPVDLELDRRRIEQLQPAALDVLDVGAEPRSERASCIGFSWKLA